MTESGIVEVDSEEWARLNELLRTKSEELEACLHRLADQNNLQMSLSDMTQERDRLKALLLSVVPNLEAFNIDYPAAAIARTAFQGGSPEEVAEKMALWDASRAQRISEWNSLVNNVRTQATV
jgi:aminopeptidase C